MSPNLGYGCSSLMGRTTLADSTAILEAAYAEGITYFDVARSYGYGEAERALGGLLRGRRDKILVATKAGFTASPPKFHIKVARSVLTPLAQAIPAIRPFLRKKAASTLVTRPALTPTSLRASLETSLVQLGSEYVDVLLLHEATASELADDTLLETLRAFVHEGKVRQFGVGSDLGKIPDILKLRADYLQVLQLENNPSVRAFETFDLSRVPMVNTHRAVGEISRKIGAKVNLDKQWAVQWSEKIGVGLTDPHQVNALLLAYSLQNNSKGRVLFSTLKPKHLRANVEVAANLHRYEAQQYEALEHLVKTLPAN